MRALKLAGDLAVSYPGRHVTEEHAQAWASELMRLADAEAQRVVALLRSRSADPPSIAQMREAIREVKGATMSGDFALHRCVYSPTVTCSQCGVVHGKPLVPDVIAHGIYHLRQFLDGQATHHEPSLRPWDCECDARTR